MTRPRRLSGQGRRAAIIADGWLGSRLRDPGLLAVRRVLDHETPATPPNGSRTAKRLAELQARRDESDRNNPKFLRIPSGFSPNMQDNAMDEGRRAGAAARPRRRIPLRSEDHTRWRAARPD